MNNKSAVPNTWEDDWATVPAPVAKTSSPAPPVKLTKAEKRAQHQELQKQLWDTAENPTRTFWLETQGVIPNKQELKPQVQLLSRKPQLAKRGDGANGTGDLSIDDGEDSEGERKKKAEADFKARQIRAQIERDEKVKKYAEARERIMGSAGSATSAASSRESSQGRDNRRGRGGRATSNRNSQPASADQSPARHSPQPGEYNQHTENGAMRRNGTVKPTTPNMNAPVRQPRAPPSDHATRGGFGFAGRGGRPAIANS
ncbi:hypothetical protein LTR62_001996 [Meristemomyces frigidus]|uniref:SUZ domain-containing protein n=1 Tax=Meristemomyces frigidus TaxID=1508187 RepID=A0AAN7TFW4_9PEZI|nr:hypothetical protein LTR62_001996 [Meristemomyces frigidus]